jgi:two-component system response regulator NreC
MKIQAVLVDDHEFLRSGLRFRLNREENIEVLADVGSAAEAYEAIQKKVPHVVVMDLDLPGEDGLSATQKIKARWPSIKVIALTGSKPSAIAKKALVSGVDGLVLKTESSDELVRAIRVVLDKKIFLSPEAATAVAASLTAAENRSTSDRAAGLTDREKAVLKALAEGRSYKEIATALELSVKSVETYRARMVKKLGCSTRAELVRCAVKLGLVRD